MRKDYVEEREKDIVEIKRLNNKIISQHQMNNNDRVNASVLLNDGQTVIIQIKLNIKYKK